MNAELAFPLIFEHAPIIIIIISSSSSSKKSAVQCWERVIYTLSVQRPLPHNANL